MQQYHEKLIPLPTEYARDYTDISGLVRDCHDDFLDELYDQAFPGRGEERASITFFGNWELSISHHRRFLVEAKLPCWQAPNVEEDRDSWYVRARLWEPLTGCLTNHLPNVEPLIYADLESEYWQDHFHFYYEVFVQRSYLRTPQGQALSDALLIWKLSQPVEPPED